MNTRELRRAFWKDHPQFKRVPGWTQNDYKAEVRMAWCWYVDQMHRRDLISDRVAQGATL